MGDGKYNMILMLLYCSLFLAKMQETYLTYIIRIVVAWIDSVSGLCVHIDNLEAPVQTNIGVEGFLMLFVNHTTRSDPRFDHPFDVFRSWSGTRLVTNSFLLFWLLTIKDQCNKCQGFFCKHNQGFGSVIFDGVLEPPHLTQHTWQSPRIFEGL